MAVARAQSPSAASPPRFAPLAWTEASDLALGYLRYVSAAWRGEARTLVFPLRLSAYWRAELPPVPATTPEAVSPHGGAGRGIAWRRAGEDVLGYVPGEHGGYRVPVSAVPSLARSTAAMDVAPIAPEGV